ncbi:hypothetical protein AN7971.2 [Aspergillus nidulans FGSC A4]|uniref:Zn(II)2Cys6 transcription factor (Eurofung) n=1 Tax=Emericella nidulans (strain FGSC A4 / ATCC 38163 / CBS 112.46 / NRRL 194 / M139) TaxID=227321 RepID=Q5AUQ9_EMENI|nr:hypothetical protein [Aspergillus nidulans FGSC A4]EAA59625.1 hypothetical protein AN7971.2 [Aspergillus nidulans FGSC A4]CBF73621.1 TPA: Putative Zn(II)2Cys6 transcription factor (Eurofung) [Aspergillus nidulans FGSC A4]|eukprot:XP_681240.1 hypothetical protein AN7971.2 [Aspergillus nidulans FGSC A4]
MADNAQRPRPPPNRRRDKVQLSCDPCRRRKLRCDRQHPCGACSRRGLTHSCSYATTSSPPDARRNVQRSVAPRQSTSLQGRISELESLVVTLMKGQPLPSPPALASPRPSSLSIADGFSEIQRLNENHAGAASPADPGTLKLRESGTSYFQSIHWEAILTKIRGLKEDLVTDSTALPGSHLFYGPNRHATRDEILAAVPPRTVVDRLMALHFDSYMITPYLIHCNKLLRETFTIDFADERAESLKVEYLTMKDVFREKAVQCLILSRYTRGGPYILETLITILTGEFVLLKESATDSWLLISLILHLAVRMGYHRDPDHFPGVSPFESEMRRRVWAIIIQLDLALSLEMGLPRSATDTHIDTKQPRNLYDSDFDEDTTEMPPPRPETEWTPVLPLIAKGRLISALGLICDINSDINPPSYDELIKADALLEDVHNRAIPPVLRWQSMPAPITDSPSLVVQRVSVEMTYHKSRILLYRRALINYPVRQPQERDRESMLHEESQPFGRLYQLRWKVSHIFNQDVLLATSVLCLYLQDVDKFEVSETAGQTTWSLRAEEIRQQLTISHKVWLQISTASAEAGKVAKALSIVLGNTEASVVDGNGCASYDFLTDFDARPLNELGAAFNNQCEKHTPPYRLPLMKVLSDFPSGFYYPLTFFDNVLESRGV